MPCDSDFLKYVTHIHILFYRDPNKGVHVNVDWPKYFPKGSAHLRIKAPRFEVDSHIIADRMAVWKKIGEL